MSIKLTEAIALEFLKRFFLQHQFGLIIVNVRPVQCLRWQILMWSAQCSVQQWTLRLYHKISKRSNLHAQDCQWRYRYVCGALSWWSCKHLILWDCSSEIAHILKISQNWAIIEHGMIQWQSGHLPTQKLRIQSPVSAALSKSPWGRYRTAQTSLKYYPLSFGVWSEKESADYHKCKTCLIFMIANLDIHCAGHLEYTPLYKGRKKTIHLLSR